jgi:sulfur-carrier protein
MNVKVLFFGKFRELASRREQTVPLNEGTQLAELLEQLSQEYGTAFRNELSNMERTHILVNGQYHNVLDDMKTPLKNGDVIALMPLATGG